MPLNNNPIQRLTFSLTPIQRVVNPVERLVFALCGIGVPAIGLSGVAMAPGFWLNWIVAVAVVSICGLVFRKPVQSLYQCLVTGEYINTVEFKDDSMGFGVDGSQAELPLKLLRVTKGLCGTVVIRHPYGYSIVLPKEVISFAELKELIERARKT